MAGSGVSSAARCRNAAAAASPPRPCARSAERTISRGDRLVRRRRRVRAMPGATVGIEGRVGRVGERPVHIAAVARVRRAVDRRADERMREAHARAELDQPRGLGRRRPPRRRSRDAPPRARAGSDRPAARPPPSGAGAACRAEAARRAARKVCSMRLANGRASGSPNPPASSAGVRSARQLEQRERVAAGLAEDPGPHPLVERPRDRRIEEQLGLVGGEPLDHELRQALEDVLARRTRAARTPAPPAPPAAGARRTPASARTRGRATARRRRCTAAAAPRRRRPAGSAPPSRRGSDPAAVRRSGRTPCSARRAAGPAAARAGRASARTARAGRRRRAPSRTRRLPPARSGSPPRRPTGAAAGRSSRRPPRRGGPAHGSGPRAPPPRVVRARRAR